MNLSTNITAAGQYCGNTREIPPWPFLIGFVVFSAIGIPLNIISGIYFATNKSKSIPNRLMMCLSVVDILSLTSGLTTSVKDTLVISRTSIAYHVSYLATVFCYNTSGFLTTTLAITRVIAISKPLYRIRTKLLYWSLVVLALLLVGQAFYDLQTYSHDQSTQTKISIIVGLTMFEYGGFLLCTSASGIVIICLVLSKVEVGETSVQTDDARRKTQQKVAIAVSIISCTFAVCNILILSLYIALLISICQSDTFVHVISLVSAFNSAMNPIIYISRNTEIQDFIKALLKKGRCCRTSWSYFFCIFP